MHTSPVLRANGRWWVAASVLPTGTSWERFWWRWHVRGLVRITARELARYERD